MTCPDLHMLQTVLLYPDKKQHNRPSFCFFHSPLLPLFAISLFFLSLSSPSHTCRFHIEGVEEDLIEYLQIRKTEDGKFQLSGQVRKKKRTRTAVAEMLSLTAGIKCFPFHIVLAVMGAWSERAWSKVVGCGLSGCGLGMSG